MIGVDVASFQGLIDWPKVKASGIHFAIARCVREGDFGVDAIYARNVAGARAAGITPGAYCFLSGDGRAATQASLFVRTIGDPTGMLIALDVEKGALTPTAADVRTFAAAWYAIWPKHPLLIYGSRGATLGTLGALADLGPLWLADYGANVSETATTVYALRGGAKAPQWNATFGGWTHPDIWQFGSKGRVPGISGDVDIDAIETADLAALTGGTDVAGLGFTITKYEHGTVTVTTDGTWAIVLKDGGHVGLAKGTTKRYVAAGHLDVPFGTAPNSQEGYLVGDGLAVLLARNVAPIPDAAPTQVDIPAVIAADRLKAHVTWQA